MPLAFCNFRASSERGFANLQKNWGMTANRNFIGPFA
jgi:hypothetical protein